ELDNTNYDAALGLARVQLELNDNLKAIKSANRAVAIKPDSSEAIALQGRIYLAMEDFDRAIARFRRAIELDPKCETAWVNLPLAYIRSDRLDEAYEAGRRAVEALPDNVPALLNLALARALRGDVKGAEADLRRARKLDPNNPEPPLRLAELLLQQGRNYKEAYRLAEESAAIDPGDGAAYALEAMALHRMGETNRAVLELKRRVQIHHHNLRLWLLLATLAQRNGDMETAKLAAAMAMRLGPRPPDKLPDNPTAEEEMTPPATGGD
ncbi:MAG: tetratricopeptide repeat protein, partial [Armatimonadetes bacterium]|nr:tetratricopeptide repeat protein [Armatimonadota bacterium]